MKIVNPEVTLLTPLKYEDILSLINIAGRTCYKSDFNNDIKAQEKFVKSLINSGHESVIEHANLSFKVICDRGVSHKIVRHRLFSFSQESSRYCNYSKEKFGKEISVINPMLDKGTKAYEIWERGIKESEKAYFDLLNAGEKTDVARSVLPNALKTELVITGNIREWRHFLKLRTARDAHPQIRQIANMIFSIISFNYPVLVFDMSIESE